MLVDKPTPGFHSAPPTGGAAGPLRHRWRPILAGVLIGIQDLDLVQVSGGTVRLFDLLAVVAVASGIGTVVNTRLTAAHKLYLTWCFAGFFSLLVGIIVFGLAPVQGLLFAVRPLQYLLVGLALTRSITDRRDWQLLAYTALAFISISIFSDIFLASGGGLSSRLGLSYGGPFELACVAGGLSFIARQKAQSMWLSAAFFLIVVFSASRVTVAAIVCVALWFALRAIFRQPQYLLILGMVVVAALAVVPAVSQSGVLETTLSRFGETGVAAEFELSADIANGIETPDTFADVQPNTIDDVKRALPTTTDADRSTLLRFTRWRLLLDRQSQQTETVLFGLGPGGGSQAVDGYYVRLLVETGWIGFVLYLAFLFRLMRDSFAERASTLVVYLVILCLSAVFVDVLVAAKAMTLLWLLVGNRD